jgi:hypothetical protein
MGFNSGLKGLMLMTSQQERTKLLQEYHKEMERNSVLATGLRFLQNVTGGQIVQL